MSVDPDLIEFIERTEALNVGHLNGPCSALVYNRVKTYATLTARDIGSLTLDELTSCIEAARTEYNALAEHARAWSRGNGTPAGAAFGAALPETQPTVRR